MLNTTLHCLLVLRSTLRYKREINSARMLRDVRLRFKISRSRGIRLAISWKTSGGSLSIDARSLEERGSGAALAKKKALTLDIDREREGENTPMAVGEVPGVRSGALYLSGCLAEIE